MVKLETRKGYVGGECSIVTNAPLGCPWRDAKGETVFQNCLYCVFMHSRYTMETMKEEDFCFYGSRDGRSLLLDSFRGSYREIHLIPGIHDRLSKRNRQIRDLRRQLRK